MGTQVPLCEHYPLTNRGVQLAEAWFRGVEITDVRWTRFRTFGPVARRWVSHPQSKVLDPKGRN